MPEEEPPVPAEGSGNRASDDDFEALARRAEADGAVRVIVGLQVAVTPGGAQEEEVNAAQRAAIRREQERIVAALEGADYSVDRRFETVSQIVLTLSPAAVEALRRSERAATLQIDEPVPPA